MRMPSGNAPVLDRASGTEPAVSANLPPCQRWQPNERDGPPGAAPPRGLRAGPAACAGWISCSSFGFPSPGFTTLSPDPPSRISGDHCLGAPHHRAPLPPATPLSRPVSVAPKPTVAALEQGRNLQAGQTDASSPARPPRAVPQRCQEWRTPPIPHPRSLPGERWAARCGCLRQDPAPAPRCARAPHDRPDVPPAFRTGPPARPSGGTSRPAAASSSSRPCAGHPTSAAALAAATSPSSTRRACRWRGSSSTTPSTAS